MEAATSVEGHCISYMRIECVCWSETCAVLYVLTLFICDGDEVDQCEEAALVVSSSSPSPPPPPPPLLYPPPQPRYSFSVQSPHRTKFIQRRRKTSLHKSEKFHRERERERERERTEENLVIIRLRARKEGRLRSGLLPTAHLTEARKSLQGRPIREKYTLGISDPPSRGSPG